MGRLILFLYGLVSYFVFFGTILYAIGFVSGLRYRRPSTPVPSCRCRRP